MQGMMGFSFECVCGVNTCVHPILEFASTDLFFCSERFVVLLKFLRTVFAVVAVAR